jgi:hypothetical protein
MRNYVVQFDSSGGEQRKQFQPWLHRHGCFVFDHDVRKEGEREPVAFFGRGIRPCRGDVCKVTRQTIACVRIHIPSVRTAANRLDNSDFCAWNSVRSI